MLIELVAGVVGAFAVAGVYMAAFRLSRRRPPRWTIMAAAAIGAIVVVTIMRYGWADRIERQLPESMVVIDRMTRTSPIEPWTLVWPVTDGLVVVDLSTRQTHEAHPGMVAAELIIVRRGAETQVGRYLIDCGAEPRRTAQVSPDYSLDDAPLPDDLSWSSEVPAALFEAACG